MSIKNKIIAITPFICIILYFLIYYLNKDLKFEALLVFLFIPAMPFLVGKKKLRFSFSFLVIVLYFAICLFFKEYNLWGKAWIIFLTIPVFHILTTPNFRDRM